MTLVSLKNKFKIKSTLLYIIMFMFVIGVVYSIFNIILWVNDSNSTKKRIRSINDNVNINIIDDTSNTEVIDPKEEISKSDPYWDYISMDLIDVNFDELKKTNNDIKGWIQVNGTNINYPFVQTNNNDYYLTHSFDKSKNKAGWVFLDYRNDLSDFESKNTIIYAHGRKDKTMFGSLKNILSNSWFNDNSNRVVKLSTEYEDTLWQVFSVYRIPTTSDYLETIFETNTHFENFLNLIIGRSAFNFNTNVSVDDRILTLSTCYNNEDKIVLHAKLIKRLKK